MRYSKSKALLGICSIFIILHHISQKVCAPWLEPGIRQHGLEPFFSVGYFFVAVFFFCSGYGLVKSFKTKEDYLKGFMGKRIFPLLLTFILTNIVYILVRIQYDGFSLPSNPYSWYVYTILLFYLCFYFVFKYMKRFQLAGMTVCLVVYTLVCYLAIPNSWLINASPVFLLGMWYEGHEDAIREKMTKRFWPVLIGLLLGCGVCFVLSENTGLIYASLSSAISYELLAIGKLVLQVLACSFFTLFLVSLTEKLPVECVVTNFLGGLTLEIYLIHGLFVQLFSASFMEVGAAPCYIRNIWLYTLAVLACSIPAAWLVHLLSGLIGKFLQKSAFAKSLLTDLRRTAMILLIALAAVTALSAYHTHSTTKGNAKKVAEYEAKNVTYVDINGSKMAASVTGEGEKTIVILHGPDDLAPIVMLSDLADALASDYRVIVPEHFGYGFSDDIDTPRTTENIVSELHTLLAELGQTEPVILLPYLTGGAYALAYLEQYPDQVAAIVGFDAFTPDCARYFSQLSHFTDEEMNLYLKRSARFERISQKFLHITGFNRMLLARYDMIFSKKSEASRAVIKEVSIDTLLTRAYQDEQRRLYENCLTTEGMVLPEDLPVMFMVDNYLVANRLWDIDWKTVYDPIITNPALQETDHMTGDTGDVYYFPTVISKKLVEFMSAH